MTAPLKTQLDLCAQAVGGAPSGLEASANAGPFKGELTVVLHANNQTAVVLALAPVASFTDAVSFRLDDLAGGSALAMSTDAPEDNCETFTIDSVGRAVDFVWVVDDSCSMSSSQTAVATVGKTAVQRIQLSSVDFRAAGVSTGDYGPMYAGTYRNWTTDLTKMLGWSRAAAAGASAGADRKRASRGCVRSSTATRRTATAATRACRGRFARTPKSMPCS